MLQSFIWLQKNWTSAHMIYFNDAFIVLFGAWNSWSQWPHCLKQMSSKIFPLCGKNSKIMTILGFGWISIAPKQHLFASVHLTSLCSLQILHSHIGLQRLERLTLWTPHLVHMFCGGETQTGLRRLRRCKRTQTALSSITAENSPQTKHPLRDQ